MVNTLKTSLPSTLQLVSKFHHQKIQSPILHRTNLKKKRIFTYYFYNRILFYYSNFIIKKIFLNYFIIKIKFFYKNRNTYSAKIFTLRFIIFEKDFTLSFYRKSFDKDRNYNSAGIIALRHSTRNCSDIRLNIFRN